MPLAIEALPITTDYDSVEDPPGSIDPLGTLTYAERLADILLPGFTARMWRARLLTVAAIGARVGDRVVSLMGNREDVRLEARLAFERLLVSAVMRAAESEPAEYKNARRGLPGSSLARRALAADEPLTRSNFLKGQAVNGPYGVVARLAKHVELLDEGGGLAREAATLVVAWSEDQGLRGILDEEGSERAGYIWLRDVAKAVAACLGNRDWPGPGSRIWEWLASRLRLDQIGAHERRVLARLMETGEIRPRVLGLLRESTLIQTYRERRRIDGRGGSERAVLVRMRDQLTSDHLDRVIDLSISVIEAYEAMSAVFQQAFDTLIWGLKREGGRAAPAMLLATPSVARQMQRTHTSLGLAIGPLERSIERMRNEPTLAGPELLEPIERVSEEARLAAASPQSMVEEVMRRHERIQKDKRKSVWIDRDRIWMLMPGFGIEGEDPPEYGGAYLHPFRVSNAYSFLADLGRVSLAISDGEEE